MKTARPLCIASALTCLVALSTACATGSASTSSPSPDRDASTSTQAGDDTPEEKLQVGPMLVRADSKGEVKETVDAQKVFDRAYEAYSARRYDEAVEHYQVIVEYFSEGRFYHPSLYNSGLAYEKLKRWPKAARVYRTIIDDFPKRSDTTDAYYRLADVYKHMEQHERIVELMTKVMLRDDVESFDRIEAHARRADALLELGEYEQAEQSFDNLLKINRQAASDERLASDSRYIVQAHFGLGRVHHEQLKVIELTLPTEKMGQDLDEKGRLLLEAQKHYLDALRQHHPHWSVASGYKIGQMYEDFYSDIFSAEIPDNLNDEQVALYFEELQNQIRPLMERAIEVYEKNLSLSARIGETPENNQWVAQTAKSLRRMKEFLNDPAARKRARELVRQGKDFRILWKPYDRAKRSIGKAVDSALERAESSTKAGADESPSEPSG